MIIPAIISVVPPTTCLVLAIYILLHGWKDKGIKVFVVLLFTLAGYGIVQVIIQMQIEITEVAQLVTFRTAFWGLIAPLSTHTILALLNEKTAYLPAGQSGRTGKRKNWFFVLMYLYVCGAVIIILSISGYTIYRQYYLTWWGWGVVMNPANWFFILFLIYLISGVAALFITLFETKQYTESYRIQKLSQMILVHFLWGGIFTILPYIILTLLNFPAEIFLAYAGNIAVFFIVYAIQKYQPEKFLAGSVYSILTTLLPSEALMITRDNMILYPLREKLLLSGFNRDDLEEKGCEKLFVNTAQLNKEMERVRLNANYSASFETECHTVNGSDMKFNISMSGIRNEFNDITAFLVVFIKQVENSNLLNYLQTCYKLSDREKEVASLLLEDLTYTQICDRLFISLNTLKTHARNIYNKTITSNRIEFKEFCNNLARMN